MQVDPIKPTLKPPGTWRLKLGFYELLRKFDFEFNMRRYTKAAEAGLPTAQYNLGRGLHSSTSQLNLSRVRH